MSDAGNSFPDDEINVEEFIGIKSFKAKGKRLSNREIDHYEWLEPFEPEIPEEPETPSDPDPDASGLNSTDSEVSNQEPSNPESTSEGSGPDTSSGSDSPKSGEAIQMELF